MRLFVYQAVISKLRLARAFVYKMKNNIHGMQTFC